MGTRRPTHAEIAKHLGLADHKSVREHRDRGMPIGSLIAAKDWYERNVVGSAGGDDPATGKKRSPGERKLAAEARIKEADAAKKELLVRKLRGELVSRDSVERWVSKAFAEVKSRLEALPDEVAGVLPPDQRASVANDMRESIALALMRLSEVEIE